MKVFNASEHLMSEDTAPAPQAMSRTTKTSPPAKPAAASKPPSSIATSDNAFDNYGDDDFATEDVDDLDDLTDALTAAGDDIDDELVFQDDPDEDKEDDSYSGQLINESELSDSFRDLEKPAEDKKFEFEGDNEEEESSSTDESWAEQMLRELEKPASAPAKTPAVDNSPKVSSKPDQASAQAPAEARSPGSSPSPTTTSSKPPPPGPHPMETTLRAERDNPYHSLRAEPISVKSNMIVETGSGWVKPLLWTVAIIALVVFLALQLAWFHFDKLARYDQLRPIYARACDVLGCTLPSLYDIGKIKSQNLVVRSHPLVNKALIIDAIVINQATFEQPFPDISLNFSDINNNIVAQRRFTPLEYLSGEAKGMTVMPPKVPVHIALEILDPGKEAVNYTLDFIATYTPEN